MVVSHFLIPGFRNRFCWDRTALREVLKFGKWIFFSTICTFIADQTDRLVVGKVTTLGTLGVYQVAHQLAWMPVYLLYHIVQAVVFPLYSRHQQSSGGIGPGVRWLHPLVTAFGAVMATGLFATGPTLIMCLYGARYDAAGWMVQFMAVGALLKMLETAASAILLGTGQSRAPAISTATKTVAFAILVPGGYYLHGLPGLLGGIVATDLVRYCVTLSALRRSGLCVLRQDVLLLLCAGGICAAAARVSQLACPPNNSWMRLGVAGGGLLVLWTAVILGYWARQAALARGKAVG
jgi:O-antigen/teichoic acid export membrane protein